MRSADTRASHDGATASRAVGPLPSPARRGTTGGVAALPGASRSRARAMSFAVTDHVSCAAYGLQQRLGETLVDLRAQPRNVHVDDVGLRVEMIVPDVLEQHRAGHDLPGVLHEIFKQAEFARLQDDLGLAASHPMRQAVELEVADPVNHLLAAA